jgi:hypothetical protein
MVTAPAGIQGNISRLAFRVCDDFMTCDRRRPAPSDIGARGTGPAYDGIRNPGCIAPLPDGTATLAQPGAAAAAEISERAERRGCEEVVASGPRSS